MHVDSSFERTIAEEEIYPLPEQKLALLPDVPTISILDPNYVPDFIPDLSLVKNEPVDTSGSHDFSIVGHIIEQPANISKAIKQELIDDAAKTVVTRHSSQCTLTRFVQEKGETGLCIEDVRSLLIADDASRGNTGLTEPIASITDEPATMPLPEVTNIT